MSAAIAYLNQLLISGMAWDKALSAAASTYKVSAATLTNSYNDFYEN